MNITQREFAQHAARYDEFAPQVDVAHPMIAFIQSRITSPARLIEFGIGTGRVALPLSACGYEVSGVDFSAEMLAELRNKPGAEKIAVVEGSFTEPHGLGLFTGVVCVFNSLYHAHTLEDQVATLRAAAESLEPQGLLFLENRAAHSFVQEYAARERLSVRGVGPDSVWLTAGTLDPLEQVVRFTHLTIGTGGITAGPVTMRYIWPDELRLMAALAGLEVVEQFADWSGTPFTADSREHIAVLRRSGTIKG